MTGKIIDDDETIKQLNDLNDENKKLKSENEDMRRLINNISHQRDEFHRGARENANRVGKLKKENEQLKAQLYCDSEEGVCSICKHHYLEKGNIFYISKCEKGHEECSKESVRHCEDFKLRECKND